MIEDKIKEYIERAIIFIKEVTPTSVVHNGGKIDFENIISVAQMLQREEHFNKTNE